MLNELKDGYGLFFGIGSGRCGTMTLANLLNQETSVIALHEGKIRHFEDSHEQLLPFLTLQNLQAYKEPEQAAAILRDKRSQMWEVRNDKGVRLLGDIAYNYAPFVKALHKVYPKAKLLFFYRDGREFVRSVITNENPDPTPVGWREAGRPLSKLERFIELGRLRPQETGLAREWSGLSAVAKNAWLWATTNQLILDGLELWDPENVYYIKYEDFFRDLESSYKALREFLGVSSELPAALFQFMERPINSRKSKVLPEWEQWSASMQEDFKRFAASMMERLGYSSG